MNWYPLLGLLALAYAVFCVYLGVTKKPDALWNMGKVIFFLFWGVLFAALGIWLFTL